LYDTVLAASRAKLLAAVAETGLAKNQIAILDALLKLRQVCCHPALLGLPETQHVPSVKLERFMELTAELIAGGHRALVFSQFTSMLAHMRAALDAHGIAYEYLDGQTKDRQARVNRFNHGTAPLFLISLKAGGTGLNLVGADYVIHYDPWWNPAVEDQATDRAHRIGQTRHVFNYKLLVKNTVEEKLALLQAKKRALVRDVLDADAWGKSLTLDDLQFLFATH
jgi:SNF2 family DNA or RNA helicase